MRARGLKIGVGGLMLVVAAVAVGLVAIKWARTGPDTPYRLVEVFERGPDGSILDGGARIRFNLDAPVDELDGKPDGKTQFRECIERLQRQKVEYRVTSPRRFNQRGDPVY